MANPYKNKTPIQEINPKSKLKMKKFISTINIKKKIRNLFEFTWFINIIDEINLNNNFNYNIMNSEIEIFRELN